jgi:hypothetical protein
MWRLHRFDSFCIQRRLPSPFVDVPLDEPGLPIETANSFDWPGY